MTLPTSDAQSPKSLADHPHSTPAASLTPTPTLSAYVPASLSPPSSISTTGRSGKITDADDDDEHATDFAASSWDLATGGLKALTAKREVPSLVERRPSGKLPTTTAAPHSYLFTVVILACLVAMLISGGVVLFLLLQP